MRVLVLGGTGAMGSHVCAKLAARGWQVTCTTRRGRTSTVSGLSYAVGDAHDRVFLDNLLSGHWDVVVDFMVWSTAEFRERYCGLLAAADQYIFTSSSRVYAESSVVCEDSPRLLDVVDDPEYLATDEYALSKARCEDLLFDSGECNWTIVRPAVTYDGFAGRLQLGVLESEEWLWRVCKDVPVPLPASMLDRQATMSWGGDVAEMIARLVGNSGALGEAFTASGSDHMTWGEVAEAYCGALPSLKVVPCSLDAFERARGGTYQIRYDRMFDRIVDNSKVLAVTGMEASSLRDMREGLPSELTLFLHRGAPALGSVGLQAKFDRLVGGIPCMRDIAREGGAALLVKYLARRVIG